MQPGGLINTMISSDLVPDSQGQFGICVLSSAEAEEYLADLANEFAPSVSAEMHAHRDAALTTGPRWLGRAVAGARGLARSGFSAIEISELFDGDKRWPGREQPTPATIRAFRAIDLAIEEGARAACVAAVARRLAAEGFEPRDFVYHASGLCISGARAADVDATVLREVINEVVAARGVDVETSGDLAFECREACAQDWQRPSFLPEGPALPNPAVELATAAFEGWTA
jgi:hypothetical protein